MPVFGVILVRTLPYLDWIRRNMGHLRIPSEYGKIRTRITPNTDTFTQCYPNLNSSSSNQVLDIYSQKIPVPLLNVVTPLRRAILDDVMGETSLMKRPLITSRSISCRGCITFKSFKVRCAAFRFCYKRIAKKSFQI